jgi:hypothetical protein
MNKDIITRLLKRTKGSSENILEGPINKGCTGYKIRLLHTKVHKDQKEDQKEDKEDYHNDYKEFRNTVTHSCDK